MKIIYAFIILLFIILITAPGLTIYGASIGLKLWYQNVLPTLLPLMLVGLLIARTDASKWLGRLLSPIIRILFGTKNEYAATAIIMGMMCGYPMCGVICSDLLKQNKISRSEHRYLMSFCNLPSPMFIVGLIWTTVLNHCITLPVLLLVYYGSMVIVSLLSRLIIKPMPLTDITSLSHAPSSTSQGQPASFPDILETAIEQVILLITKIGLYMMVVCAILQHLSRVLPSDSLLPACIISTILEMTSGINLAADAYADGTLGHTLLILFCILGSGFGGICVLMQIFSATKNTRYSMKEYLAWKILYIAIMTLIFCLTEWAK